MNIPRCELQPQHVEATPVRDSVFSQWEAGQSQKIEQEPKTVTVQRLTRVEQCEEKIDLLTEAVIMSSPVRHRMYLIGWFMHAFLL